MNKHTRLRNALVAKTKRTHGVVSCSYCGRVLEDVEVTLDHRHPLVGGGENAETNVVLACRLCNCLKSNHLESDFRAWIASLPLGLYRTLRLPFKAALGALGGNFGRDLDALPSAGWAKSFKLTTRPFAVLRNRAPFLTGPDSGAVRDWGED